MLVKDQMTTPVITISPETPFQDALKVMREHKIRRIPVVNERHKLVGIVSERDLLHAEPSPATSLSVWELNYLLWKLTIRDVMNTDVITVTPLTTLQDAASLLIKYKIGGLPVVNADEQVVGIITETDIFKAFVDYLTTEPVVYA
ncbi:MAG: CBS domain-containing protein [Caldilineaceae bacterium]|nr:CBS domain-containing protein [Caldilineaceae bacterium]